MESGEVEALVERLVANPHDSEALARAHRQGEADPQGYANLLEQVGTRTEDASYASHWLSEAANIWSVTLGDAHRAARVLMIAVDRDPTQPLAADRLAQLYRDKGDIKALVAMLDRRVRLLTPMLGSKAELRELVAGLHEELGRLWTEAPLTQPRKAIEHYRRSIELDPSSAFSIFSVREIYKSLQQWDEALAMYDLELAAERDPERRLLLRRDEAETRKLAGDLQGVTRALRAALEELRQGGSDDPVLAQQIASSMLERRQAGGEIDDEERAYGADLLVSLAESFQGEHGMAYAGGALDLLPGHDRAMQLYAFFGAGGLPADDLSMRYHAYLAANPDGPLAAEARQVLSSSYESLGQVDQAIQVLDPLRGDPDIERRLRELLARSPGAMIPTPIGGVEEISSAALAIDTDENEGVTHRPPPLEAKEGALEAAQICVAKGDKKGALEKYLEVLEADPGEPEALSWVEDQLRSKRDYAKLRDVLSASARALSSQDSIETRKTRLREIAGLSESNLKDLDGAINAWRQIVSLDRSDDAARQSLVRLLEKGQRWDDLAIVYEQEASTHPDVDAKIALEKKLAVLHEQKRKDLLAAGEAWSRIADLTPEDDRAVDTASTLFEKAGRLDLAAQVILGRSDSLDDKTARAVLLDRLGGLFTRMEDHAAAAQAYEKAAEAEPTAARWSAAEKAFAGTKHWVMAAQAAEREGNLGDASKRAGGLARASGYLFEGGDSDGAIQRLERAHELLPDEDEYTTKLAELYRSGGQATKLAAFLVVQGGLSKNKDRRVAAFREAASLYESPLVDPKSARAQWEKVLADGDDAEALEHLAALAITEESLTEAAAFLRRLGALAETAEEKTKVALREADLLARSGGDLQAAIDRYEWVLSELDKKCRPALRAIANLEEKRGAPAAAAKALERELLLDLSPEQQREIAGRLATTYEGLGDLGNAFKALQVIRAADPDDFDVLGRLASLAEKLERWEDLEHLLASQIEVEADDTEISALTRKRAGLLADKLGRGDDALAALLEVADTDPEVRDAYVELGDRLGWRGIVATKLVEWWFPAQPTPQRKEALVGAFGRFALVGRDVDAVRVGVEILRHDRDPSVAQQLEEFAAKTSNVDALSAAQEILGGELSGLARAAELVRQAELRAKAGMPIGEAVEHGETGLGGLSPEEIDPLLTRLAALIPDASGVVDLYERQVSRSRGTEARHKALARAAQVAGERNALPRARTFFDLALTGTPSDEMLDALERAAVDGDKGGLELRRTLALALSHGAEGTRDGGRSRAGFLRRAAEIARRDLHDVDQAFAWIGDALIAHVDAAALDALFALTAEVKEPRRADDVLSRALGEVFDGPLVRLLLARRAQLRREQLDDRAGAALDLKKLHDLSPTDDAIMAELSSLLTELGDHRALVQLYEDQILRSKDQGARAELARKVAHAWEGDLADPREAADAWRRVLRLKPGDAEATAGLDRAKSGMLKKSEPRPATAAKERGEESLEDKEKPTKAEEPEGKEAARSDKADESLGKGEAKAPKSVRPASKRPSVAPPPPSKRPSVAPMQAATPPVPGVRSAPPQAGVSPAVPPAPLSSEEIDEIDLVSPSLEGPTTGENDAAPRSPTVQAALDAHTSAARTTPPRAPASGRPSKPPPLPPSSRRPSSVPAPYDPNDPPTSPGRRLDAGGPASVSPSERAMAMTDENAPLDFTDETSTGGIPAFTSEGPPPEVPPELVSASELLAEDEPLVVDEFVQDIEEEQFEDVAEPSKPHGHLPS